MTILLNLTFENILHLLEILNDYYVIKKHTLLSEVPDPRSGYLVISKPFQVRESGLG